MGALIQGQITAEGAVVDLLVGVSDRRAELLRRHNFPVPPAVPLRAVLDSGSAVTVVGLSIFQQLGVEALNAVPIATPSTPRDDPHYALVFDASLALVANGRPHAIPGIRVLATDQFDARDRAGAIVGTDVLNRCHFLYLGPERTFSLGF